VESAQHDGAEAQRDEGKPTRRWWPVAVFAIAAALLAAGYSIRSLRPAAGGDAVQIADVSSERLIGYGSVVGFAAARDTHAWLGIPFARPPVDGLRWRAPVPPDAWADTLDALRTGSPCPQLSSPLAGVASDEPGGFAGAEDCLTLNIWAPRAEPDAVPRGPDRLPVMLWIHGGGNTTGEGGSPMYDGARLAGDQNLVVVTINYRLGPFGWFSHPALRGQTSSLAEASGNFGTLDQIRALEWVQENIEEFGGDPGSVTVFGESAGGTNVLALMLAEPARGLFHRAIAQSGSTDSVSRAEAENAYDARNPGLRHSSAEIVVRLLAEVGVVPDRDAARRYADELSDTVLVDFLRGRPAYEILDAYRDPDDESQIALPKLIRDGTVLPEGDWLEAFRAGRFNAVPILLGSNRDEMKLFHFRDTDHVRRRFQIFYRIRDLEDYQRRSRYASDLWRVRAVDRPAAAISASGRAAVFAYRFDWDEEPRRLGTELSTLLGAAHGFEIPFVFGNFRLGDSFLSGLVFDAQTRPSRELLAERMMGYWAEFARTGRPARGGRDDLPEWLMWRKTESDLGSGVVPSGAGVLVLDTERDGGIRLSSVPMTRDLVIAAVDSDSTLGQDEKCALFRDLFIDRPDWDVEEFRRIGRRGCADYPLDVSGGLGP
jgi:para-nitrobenzyl esterase